MGIQVTPRPSSAESLTNGVLGSGAVVLASTLTSYRGLYRQVMSDAPTSSSTGLSTWVNQGTATLVEHSTGICIYNTGTGDSTDKLSLRSRVAPSTPYTITALLAMGGWASTYATAGIGWYDAANSTKIEAICISGGAGPGGGTSGIRVFQWASPTAVTIAGTDFGVASPVDNFSWLQISDDGTTVSFKWSADGGRFTTGYSVAKASGYLGASGYSNIVFVLDANASTGNPEIAATLMSWTQS